MDRSLQAIIATVALSPLLPIIHIVIIRLLRKLPNHVVYMFVSFVFYSTVVVYYNHTIHNGFTSPTATSMACIVIICLLYAEFFSMVCRGFSLQIMVDIFTGEKTELKDLINGYAGKGIHWLLKKRIASLKSLGLIVATEKHIILSNWTALIIGRIGLGFKNLFNLPHGG